MADQKALPAVPPYAWVILGLVFFASVAAPLNQFKVPPLMTTIMAEFGISPGTAGWLMSVFSVIGIMLALPGGFIMGRIGVKNTGLLALGSLLAGGLLGAFSGSLGVLLFSRVLEGVGMCLMSILAPTALAVWFPPDKRGTAMGIWGTWVATGCILVFFTAPTLSAALGWKSVWWACAVYTAILLAAWLLMFRLPEGASAAAAPKNAFKEELKKMSGALKSPEPWKLAASFGCYNIFTIAIISFMPMYFEKELGYSTAAAALVTNLYLVSNMIAVVPSGIISDKIGSRKKLIVLGNVILALCMAFYFLPGNLVIVTMAATGFIGGFIVTPTFSAAPEIVSRPEDVGASLAVLAVGLNSGMFLGPFAFGTLFNSFGWTVAGYAMIPVLALGAVLAIRIKVR